MNRYFRTGLLALVFAATLALSACGGGQQGGDDANDGGGQQGDGGGSMQGMDHGEMSGMDTTMEETTGMEGMEGMDMGSMDMGSMLMEDGEYSDRRFIDLMVPHHRGAVEMARVALDGNAEHQEIERLSENIVSSQKREVKELRDIRQEEFGTRDIARDTPRADMEMMMGTMMDPDQLARQDPFDLAFMDNMIPHHRSAIDMAEVALENTDNPRIRELAQEIIEAQEREIEQMRQWRQKWYPER